jgi:hypothetical protein
MVSIVKKPQASLGWEVTSRFQIGVHGRDLPLLEAIKAYWGGIGSISEAGKGVLVYKVSSLKDLTVIINHFDRYPLITQKLADYLLFKRIVNIKKSGGHLTLEGLQEIINIRASINSL